MSVRDYIKNHYGPYMCKTQRHKWILDCRATEQKDGSEHCEWCGKKQKIIWAALLGCMKKCRPGKFNILAALNEGNSVIEGVFKEVGVE